MRIQLAIYCLLSIAPTYLYGQKFDSTVDKIAQFPNRFFSKLLQKETSLEDNLTKETEKYLEKLARKERKIQEKLSKIDSNAAKNLFAGTQAKYTEFENKIKSLGDGADHALSGEYLPYTDSLNGALSFLKNNQQLLSGSTKLREQLGLSLADFNQLQYKLKTSDQIKEFIRQRKQQLHEIVEKYANSLGLNRYLDEYNKQAYYYAQQVKEYKEMLNDPDRLMKKALTYLNQLPAFKEFMKNNSQLAGLFNVSGDYGTPEALVGLQTREQIQQLVQSQLGAGTGGITALQQNLQAAHQQLDNFKQKLNDLGRETGDIDMPNFRPNNQKTKPFLKRLEYGVNLQTTRSSYFFPTTTDIGLSIGYKMGNKGIIGIGGSYNIGWGADISHINITSQGVGIRSFLDFQLKKNLYASGGFEYNYQKPFSNLQQIQDLNLWQKSGLIGLSKMVSFTGKIIKKTKLSVLWDFLSYYQIPQTQPFLFRVGYNF